MKAFAFGLALLVAGFVAADSRGEEGNKKRAQTMSGTVTKADAGSITIARKGEGGTSSSTDFAIGTGTKILVQTAEDDIVKGEGGRERKVPKTKDGTASDLKTSQQVVVTFTEQGKADSITVLRPAPVRKGGEGDK